MVFNTISSFPRTYVKLSNAISVVKVPFDRSNFPRTTLPFSSKIGALSELLMIMVTTVFLSVAFFVLFTLLRLVFLLSVVVNFSDKLNENSFDDVKINIKVAMFTSAAPRELSVTFPLRSTEILLRNSEGTVVETLLPIPMVLATVIKGLTEASIKIAVVPAKNFLNITYSSFHYNLNLPSNSVNNGAFLLLSLHIRFFDYIIHSFFSKINRFDRFQLICTGF